MIAFLFYQLIALISMPVFCVIHAKQGAPFTRLSERFGFTKTTAKREPHKRVYIHAASLGEIKQASLIAQKLHDGGADIHVSTFTQNGAVWVQKFMPFATHHFVPIDLYPVMHKFLRTLQPDIVLVIEADIWPAMIHIANRRKIPIGLLNVRASKSRMRWPRLYRGVMQKFDFITYSTAALGHELATLGINPDKMYQTADLKSYPALDAFAFDDEISNYCADNAVWIAASTHENDEPLIFETLQTLRGENANIRAIWAPRHLERASPIHSKLVAEGFSVSLKTNGISTDTDILILDTFGDLASAYQHAKLVYLGGGLGTHGGHNPREIETANIPILSGAQVENHAAAFEALITSGVARFIETPSELVNAVIAIAASEPKSLSTSREAETDNIETDQTLGLIRDRLTSHQR